jgi:hypothetical protein
MSDNETTTTDAPPATETAPAEGGGVTPTGSAAGNPVQSTAGTDALLDGFMSKLGGGGETAPPESTPAPETTTAPAQDAPAVSDALTSFLGGETPQQTETPAESQESAPESDPEQIDPATLKSAENWAKAKEGVRSKVEAEYANRLQALEQKLQEREASYEEVSAELAKYNLAKSPAFKAEYVAPKRESIAAIERVAGEHEGAKKLIASMRAGNLNISDMPSLEGLNDFQRSRVVEAADKWLQVDEREQTALANQSETQKELELREMEMEREQASRYQGQLANQLHHATSKATAEAAGRLPGFSEQHVNRVMSQLSGDDVWGEVSRSMAVAAWAQTQIPEMHAQRQTMAQELQAAREEIAALQQRLGGASDLNRLTTSQSAGTPGEAPKTSGAVLDGFMQDIARRAQQG